MSGAPFLSGERVTLRTVEPADHAFLHRHWNDPVIRHGFAWSLPRNRERLADDLDRSDGSVDFLVCHEDDPVGYLWLFGIDETAGRADLGYWIAPDEQGQGYATEAVELGVRYAFDDRRLHKLVARVFEDNDASRRVLEKAGFRQEGYLRDHYYVDGEHVDTYIYGLLAPEA